MAAPSTRTKPALLACLIALAMPVHAADESYFGEASRAERQAARERLAHAVTRLEDRMQACREQERTIPSEVLEDVRLNDEQLGLALDYLSLRANNECIEPEAGQFVIAAAMVRRTDAEASRNGDTEDFPQVEELVLHSFRQEIELQVRYQELPEEGRSDLEEVEALREPFDPVATAEAAGLY